MSRIFVLLLIGMMIPNESVADADFTQNISCAKGGCELNCVMTEGKGKIYKNLKNVHLKVINENSMLFSLLSENLQQSTIVIQGETFCEILNHSTTSTAGD